MKTVQLAKVIRFLSLMVLITVLGCTGTDTESVPIPIESQGSGEVVVSSEPGTTYVIDVRSEDEYSDGHIDGAVHIPHDEIVQRIESVTNDKNAKIIVYCAAGVRAGKAKSALESSGFTNVENGGGLSDMKARNLVR